MKRMIALCGVLLLLAGCQTLPEPDQLAAYGQTVNAALEANDVRGSALLILPTDLGMHTSTTFGSQGLIVLQVSGDAGE